MDMELSWGLWFCPELLEVVSGKVDMQLWELPCGGDGGSTWAPVSAGVVVGDTHIQPSPGAKALHGQTGDTAPEDRHSRGTLRSGFLRWRGPERSLVEPP